MQLLLDVFHLFVIAPVILGQSLGLNLGDPALPAAWASPSTAELLSLAVFFAAAGTLLALIAYRVADRLAPPEIKTERSE